MFRKMAVSTPPNSSYDLEFLLYAEESTNRRSQTASFSSGLYVFDLTNRTVTNKGSVLSLPDDLDLQPGMSVLIRLVRADGTMAKVRTRSAILVTRENRPGKLYIPARMKQESELSAEDGWQYTTIKYRVYPDHTGVKTDPFPQWMDESNRRSLRFWNRLSYLELQARRACSNASVDKLVEYRDTILFPALKRFNESVKKRQTIKFPKDLKVEMPDLAPFFRFARKLEVWAAKGRLVPDGMAAQVRIFATSFKSDMAPFYEFEKNVKEICKEEAKRFGLKPYEQTEISNRFIGQMARRRKYKMTFDKGHPRIKYSEDRGADDWSIHYQDVETGTTTDRIFTNGKGGVPSVYFGPAVASKDSGHPEMGTKTTPDGRVVPCPESRNLRRYLRPVTIALGKKKYTFAILQHSEIPPNSYLKQWKLVHTEGTYWFCLTLQVQRPVAVKEGLFAGLEIGWRQVDGGTRIARLFNPATQTNHDIIMDLDNEHPCAPEDNKHVPFLARMGPTRWARGEAKKAGWNRSGKNLDTDEKITEDLKQLHAAINKNLLTLEEARTRFSEFLEASKLFIFTDTFPGTRSLQQRREALKDVAKALIKLALADKCPQWWSKCGIKSMRKVVHEVSNPVAAAIIDQWSEVDRFIGDRYRFIFARLSGRLDTEQYHIAHDLCKALVGHVVGIALEENFIAKLAQQKSVDDPEAIKRSAKYRQWASLSSFAIILEQVAAKYGLSIKRVEVKDTSAICNTCGYRNTIGAARVYQCGDCGRSADTDENAARNISLAASTGQQETGQEVSEPPLVL